jgi:hypothetical protein
MGDGRRLPRGRRGGEAAARGSASLGAGADHDRGAVRVVGADVGALVAAELLKPHEDVGLDVFDEVPEVDVPIGIGQRRGDENTAPGGERHAGATRAEREDSSGL